MAGLCHCHGGTPSPAHGTGGSLPARFFLPGGGHGAGTHRTAIHGAGSGKGEGLSLITQAEGFPSYLQSGQLGSPNACVLIPQLPATYRGWSDMDGVLMQLISALQDQGSNARIEILEGADHFAVPGLAYLGGYGLVDWLIGN